MRLWWHKLKNWEYWNNKVIYAPTVLLWLCWMIKFKSLKFYKYANPSIKNGGLYGDSKAEIYHLLPNNSYPKTLLIHNKDINDFKTILQINNLSFPLIVKPDIGYRGILVEKIYSLIELYQYEKRVKQKFLIQELCEYPNEIGLFYCRKPNEANGKITGLTVKQFLKIKGNGIDSIRNILNKTYRYKMQIKKLEHLIDLNIVLAVDEEVCLVPFGNHNRGTIFLNGKNKITKKLENTFNELLKNINGFYYGRLDIRFNNFAELEDGKNFSIIELNGVKSEPTHIYDPSNSFFSALKEIYRHQKIMKEIVAINLRNKQQNQTLN
jgi:hypothetical protein